MESHSYEPSLGPELVSMLQDTDQLLAEAQRDVDAVGQHHDSIPSGIESTIEMTNSTWSGLQHCELSDQTVQGDAKTAKESARRRAAVPGDMNETEGSP
jgi:hypothetical protein